MLVVLLTLFASSPTCYAFGHETADLILPTKTGQQLSDYSPTYEKCLSTRKILHGGRCWSLLTKGPCEEGQWLVLDWAGDGGDREQPLRAKCARRRCSESDVYWPWDGFCYDAETAERRRLCPRPDTELTTDEFGDGFCECRDDDKVPYVRLVSSADDDDDDDDGGGDDSQRPCFAVYARGPCPFGQVIAAFGRGYGNCTADECAAERRRRGRQREPIARWADGRCYELGTRGPCASNEQFTVARDVMRPGCLSKVTVLDLFSNKKSGAAAAAQTTTAQPCETDHRGACVDDVDVSADDPTYGFKEQLMASAARHAKRDKDRKRKRTSSSSSSSSSNDSSSRSTTTEQ